MCDITGSLNIDPDQFAATCDGTGAGQRLMVEIAGGGHGVLSGRKAFELQHLLVPINISRRSAQSGHKRQGRR